LGFNYSVWTQGTAITLANVPWNSDYRDIVRFDSQSALDNYIANNAGPVIDIPRVSYAKFGRPIRLDTPFHTVQNYNYLRAFNPAQPIQGDTSRAFYYFIVDVVYVAPNTTEIYVQLDVWQTFGYGVTFGNCYIQQGHIGIANKNSFTNFGRDYLTVPEGLDLGNEYEIDAQYSHSIASARDGEPDFEILVVSAVALDEDPGTVDAPKLTSATGSAMENLPNGAEIYQFTSMEHFKSFMAVMKDKPWITQGIMSIQAVPPLGRYGFSSTGKTISGISVNQINGGSLMRPYVNMAEGWRNNVNLGRYWRLSKFLTYPYTVLEMTSYTGTPLVLKPECLQTSDLGIVEVPHIAPPNARIAFYPYRYNAGAAPSYSDDKGVVNDGGEFLDMVTGIMDFPAFSVVNNGYMQFMASNQAGVAYQHASADWSQTRALQGNATSYDQATAGINTTNELNRIGMNAASMQTAQQIQTSAYQGMQSAANAFVDGFQTLNPLTAVRGTANAAVSHAIGANQANGALGISNAAAAASTKAGTENSAYLRDSNKSLADWSANGDYQNQIAGINARVQDAKLTQPTTAGQVGGNAFNLATYRWGVDIKVKRLTPAFMNAIGEYWLRYGYAINRFGKMPEGFMVMEKFTYWKLKESYITASQCPENFKQVIRGIFEKGVTVWKNPADIGNIDIADNAPLGGVYY
jgi:hypothetical protein